MVEVGGGKWFVLVVVTIGKKRVVNKEEEVV